MKVLALLLVVVSLSVVAAGRRTIVIESGVSSSLVTGTAWSFGPGGPIKNATIFNLHNLNHTTTTDEHGAYSFGQVPVGTMITPVMASHPGWHTPFQGPTVIVPPQGLTGRMGTKY
jgi:hypothetical protein